MAVEERIFTKAESKMFAAKYEVFQTAQKAVDEVVVFLREQYGIAEDEQGWQIGQNGFFRMKDDAPPAGDNAPPTGEEAKGKK